MNLSFFKWEESNFSQAFSETELNLLIKNQLYIIIWNIL